MKKDSFKHKVHLHIHTIRYVVHRKRSRSKSNSVRMPNVSTKTINHLSTAPDTTQKADLSHPGSAPILLPVLCGV